MRIIKLSVLTLFIAVVASNTAMSNTSQAGNLGYNSYEGYLSEGHGLNRNFGPGVGYPTYDDESGEYFRRYIPSSDWGIYGYGTGHMGEGYGPYIYSRREGGSPPGMFDPLPGAYRDAPPPRVKIKHGMIYVSMPSNIPGVQKVTVTMVAFNNADLETQVLCAPPYEFEFPVLDGVKNVRVRIDYVNNGLSATSYPL